MIKHSFSDFSYAINTTSEKKGRKEILVCYIYNGVEVLKKVYIPEKAGTAYIFEAKKIIDQEMRSGALSAYSHKFVKRKNKEAAKKKKKEEKAKAKAQAALKSNKPEVKKPDEPRKEKKNGFTIITVVAAALAAALVVGLTAGLATYFATRPTPVTTYKVIFNLDGCNHDGAETVEKDKTYTCNIHPDTPNDKEVNVFDITMAGEKLAYQTDYTFINDKLDITKPATGDITIAATVRDKTFNVFWSADGCDVTDASETVARSHTYSCKIKTKNPTGNYAEVLAVTMGGIPLKRGADYSFDSETGVLEVSKPATGNIVIVANSLPLAPTNLAVYNYTPGCNFSGSEKATIDQPYKCTITSKNSGEIPHIVAVKIGTNRILQENADYTVGLENNVLTLTIDKVAYDEYITIIAMAQPTVVEYKVIDQCTGCTFNSSTGGVVAPGASDIDLGTFSSDSGAVNLASITMGGTLLANKKDYTIDDNNKLHLIKAADGDILISATAIDSTQYAVGVSFPNGCTFDGSFVVDKDSTYSCSFTPSAGKIVEIVSVIMDGTPLSCEGADPSYMWVKSPVTAAGDKGEMKLTINKKASGHIVIVVTTEDIGNATFNVEHNLFETKLITGSTSVKANSTYTCKIAVNDELIGIKEPRALAVMMGGGKLSSPSEYTFKKESNTNNYVLDIIKPATGFISINVCATQIEKANYNINILSYACTNNAPKSVPASTQNLSFDILPENPSNIVEVFTVSMGGRNLTLSKEYIFNGKTLTFLTPVIGDITIAATSRSPDRISAVGIVNEAGEVTGLNCSADKKPTLQDVIIPTKVTSSVNNDDIIVSSIPFGLLNGCSKIETVTIPFIGHTTDSENYDALFGYIFGDTVFDGVGSLTWQTFYTDKSEEAQYYKITKAAIPTSLTDVTINGGNIPKGAFSACRFIETVKFNDFIDDGSGASIGAYAFYNCTSLKKVEFPTVTTEYTKKVTTIEWRAFEGCVLLRTFDLTYVDDIFHNAFNGCDGMQGIYIPATIQHIGADAFANITLSTVICALTRDEVEEKITEGSWKSNWIADTALVIYGFYSEKIYQDDNYRFIIIRKDSSATPSYGACIIEYLGSDRIPTITIPNTLAGPDNKDYPVLEIGAQVFFGYTLVETINFECSELRVIDNYCFTSCNMLRDISTLKNTALKTLGTYAFDRCVNLTIDDSNEKTFPSSLKSIGKYAFAYCDDGNSPTEHAINIDLSETNVKVLPERMFYQSNNLMSFISPMYTEDLGVETFEGCKDMETMHLSVCGFDEIPDQAFKECKSLKSFHLFNTDTVKLGRIGQEAFEACFNLSDLQLSLEGVAVIGNSAFKGCHALASLDWNLPVLGTLGDNVFENCSQLSSVTFVAPELKEISNNAFLDCMNLESFTLKSSSSSATLNKLTRIGSAAFKRTKISNIDMDSSALTKIDENAFESCESLTSAHFIAPSLTTIGANAFKGCTALESCLFDYSTTSHTLTKLTTIGASAFANCTALTKLFYADSSRSYIPECVTSIDNFAFANCTAINKIRFVYNSTYHPDHGKMFMGAQVFQNWTTYDSVEIDVNWTWKQTVVDTTRITYWGWNMSGSGMYSNHMFCGAATGSDTVVIYIYNA